MAGLWRMATMVDMYRTLRTWPRPPPIKRFLFGDN
jgi:hypothetical protein